jgi:hypothetical protein
MPKVNFDKAGGENILVLDGKYLCRVVDIEVKQTKTGKEMWVLHLQIETEGEFYGKRLFHNLVFGESSWWVVKEFYEAALDCPMTGERECYVSDLLDKYIFVHIKGSREYNGKKQPIISVIESAKGTDTEIPF